MGTRNLVAVYSKGAPVIAQYGQWDGHPSGQGKTALEFCTAHLSTQAGRDAFKVKLTQCRWVTDEEIQDAHEAVGIKGGFMTMEQSKKLDQILPYLSRDIGASILEMVRISPVDVLLVNSIEFAGESLFCEFAYVVDLDRNTFEAYVGFQKSRTTGQRFSELHGKGEYAPVKLAGSWSLDALPDYDTFASEVATAGE